MPAKITLLIVIAGETFGEHSRGFSMSAGFLLFGIRRLLRLNAFHTLHECVQCGDQSHLLDRARPRIEQFLSAHEVRKAARAADCDVEPFAGEQEVNASDEGT